MTTVQITSTDSFTTEQPEFIAIMRNPKWINGTSSYPFMVIIEHQFYQGIYEFETYATALAVAIEKQDQLRTNITDEFDERN